MPQCGYECDDLIILQQKHSRCVQTTTQHYHNHESIQEARNKYCRLVCTRCMSEIIIFACGSLESKCICDEAKDSGPNKPCDVTTSIQLSASCMQPCTPHQLHGMSEETRSGDAVPAGSKPCTMCGTLRQVLVRCQIDESGKWNFVCPGKCWHAVSGGVEDAKGLEAQHPFYRYGGMVSIFDPEVGVGTADDGRSGRISTRMGL